MDGNDNEKVRDINNEKEKRLQERIAENDRRGI
jgi:hypothetical protein